MTVYHGTAECCVEPIKKGGLERRLYPHVDRKCACTTTSLRVASLFAIRKTPAVEWSKGRVTGVVLEFELTGDEGRDYEHVDDKRSMQHESEVVVFNTRRLRLVATQAFDNESNAWIRTEAV